MRCGTKHVYHQISTFLWKNGSFNGYGSLESGPPNPKRLFDKILAKKSPKKLSCLIYASQSLTRHVSVKVISNLREKTNGQYPWQSIPTFHSLNFIDWDLINTFSDTVLFKLKKILIPTKSAIQHRKNLFHKIKSHLKPWICGFYSANK